MRRFCILTSCALLVVVAGCQSNGSSAGGTSHTTGFALRASAAKPGSEARVTLRSSAGGPYVTLIAELNYDASRLSFKDCALANGLDQTTSVGKTLNVLEPTRGLVRAVVAGTVQPLPTSSDWFTCSFDVAADAAGDAPVTAHGGVANSNFEDEEFTAAGHVAIGK